MITEYFTILNPKQRTESKVNESSSPSTTAPAFEDGDLIALIDGSNNSGHLCEVIHTLQRDTDEDQEYIVSIIHWEFLNAYLSKLVIEKKSQWGPIRSRWGKRIVSQKEITLVLKKIWHVRTPKFVLNKCKQFIYECHRSRP